MTALSARFDELQATMTAIDLRAVETHRREAATMSHLPHGSRINHAIAAERHATG
jgi:hypothetical protein